MGYLNILMRFQKHKICNIDKNGALTKDFLLSRGFCCKNGCKNCPWREKTLDNEKKE